MKSISLLITASCLTVVCYSQSAISIDSLSSHIGETVTICNKVYGTRYLEQANKQPTFINVGAAYPNSLLTVVIFGDDRKNFKEAPEVTYADKNICVTGQLKDFKGKAQIIVSTPDQIKGLK